jgi:hypothetical protein
LDKNGGAQRVLVVAGFAGAQIGEGGGEAGSAADFVQQFSDTHLRSMVSITAANASASGGVGA